MPRILIFLSCLILVVSLAGCAPGVTEDMLVTEVAQTVVAEITQTAAAAPTATATATATATITPTLALTPSLQTTTQGGLPTAATGGTPAAGGTPAGPSGSPSTTGCDIASFVSDISIPDGTHIPAGGSFKKTWQLRNDGTCTWNSSYKLVFHSGEQMNGPASQQLTAQSVAPGQTANVSVNLVAPTTDGSYYSYWILQNDSGLNFGIGPEGGTFYVQIIVGEGGATSPTSAATRVP